MNDKGRIPTTEKILVDFTEGAALLSISRPTLYRLAKIDGFPVVKVGSRRLLKREGLVTWFETHGEALQ